MKTNNGLVEYCKAQLGLPYWYGTFGQIATAYIYQYNKSRLPNYYAASDFPSQIGKRVHDCIGLVKGYLWSDSPTSTPVYCAAACPMDFSADGMLSFCKEKGAIGTIPELPGTLVFMKGHVGVYIGGGWVIEARGHKYGVVQTKLRERPWTHWGKCPYITYEEVEEVTQEKFDEMLDKWLAKRAEAEEPDWSKTEGAFKAMKEKGLMDGTRPQSFVTRCELAALMERSK